MIWESSYWKDELLRSAARLRRRLGQRRWPASSLAKVEREIMIGFFMIRKLLDARKVNDQLPSRAVPLREHPPTGRKIHHMNWHKLEELYELDQSAGVTRDLRFVCSQMVHTYVFMTAHGEDGGLAGAYFASDHERDRRLFLIDAEEIIRCFEDVGRDHPNQVSATRPAGDSDWQMVAETLDGRA